MDDIVSSTETLISKKQKLDTDGGYSQTGEKYLTGDYDAEEAWCSDDDASYGDTESDEELVDAAAKQKEYIEKHFANLREMTDEECRVYYDMEKESESSGYRLKEVVMANCHPVAGIMYCITFKATDTDTNNGPEIFQAKVWNQIYDMIEIKFCRKTISATK